MLRVGRCLYDREAIALQKHLKGVARRLTGFRIVLEQLEEIRVLEVLLEVLASLGTTRAINCRQVHAFLVDLAAVDLILDRSHRHQSIHDHVPLLPDSENPIDRLVVVGRVPVGVQNYGALRPRQIEAEASNLGRQEPAED